MSSCFGTDHAFLWVFIGGIKGKKWLSVIAAYTKKNQGHHSNFSHT
jgi:hypothetical protein